MLALLALLAPAQAADGCLVTVDKGIKDDAPVIYAECRSSESRLNTAKGIQITAPDGAGGENVWTDTLLDSREIYKTKSSFADSTGTYTLTVGVGAALDADGKRRRRRGDCKFDDFTIGKGPYRRTCTVKLEDNAAATEVTVDAQLNRSGKTVYRVALDGPTFTADEEAVVDYTLTDAEGNEADSGALSFRRSRASTTIAFNDRQLPTYSSFVDPTVFEGWTHTVLAADGASVVLEGAGDIDADIVDGALQASVAALADGTVEMTLRGRADRNQDVSSVQFSICESDCSESTVFDAELEVVQRFGLAASGSGDPLDQSWTIESTGYDAEGNIVAGPYSVEVKGVEGKAEGERNITGGSLRRDSISWRLGRGKKRTDWLEWNNAELVPRTRLPAHKWTHVVVANGKSSLRIGGENWRDQRLRASDSFAAEELVAPLTDVLSSCGSETCETSGDVTVYDSSGQRLNHSGGVLKVKVGNDGLQIYGTSTFDGDAYFN